MNILITNAVPLNGGDEALLRATVQSLQRRWPQCSITTLCKDVEPARRQLPDLKLESDLEFASGATLREVSRYYREADVVVSAPGGFLHDFYPIAHRLRGFEVALALGKPLILLGQSLGPFWKAESLRRIPQVLNRAARICTRDAASRQHLLDAGIHPGHIRETADAAFLWRRLAPELFRSKSGPMRTICLSLRLWPLHDEEGGKQTVAKAEQLCRFLLDEPDRELVFLSTCQGIPGYADDSALAIQIVERLPRDLQARCRINRDRLGPLALIKAFSECDAFIGMRLHGCLLAMLGGTPAMGLGYEQKTPEIFRQLDLEAYQLPFEEPAAAWQRCAERFLAQADTIRAALPAALDQACRRAELNLDALASILPSAAPIGGVAPEQPQSEWKDLVTKYGVPHLRLRQVAALIEQVHPDQLLDLGCATGELARLCPGMEYVGCDFVAPKKRRTFPFYQCDFNREPLPADLRELAAISCSGLLEYIEDLPAFLAQLRARLKPNGHLIATYFNMNHISRILALLRGKSFPARRDWRGFYSPRDFKQLVAAAGFEIIQSLAMNHSLRPAAAVDKTVNCPLTLLPERPWSVLLAHQILLVAKAKPGAVAGMPVQEIASAVPPASRFILVDDAQWAGEVFPDRQAIPFLEKDGQYWGAPADDETAIRELERLRQTGATHIVFAAQAFWWLDYYREFTQYLRANFRCVLQNERWVVFDLRTKGE